MSIDIQPPSPKVHPTSSTCHFLNTAIPNLSISRPSWVFRPAASSSFAHVSASLILTASSAARTRIPHFSYMVMISAGSRPVHLGTKTAARRGLPACRVWLKKGCNVGVSGRRGKGLERVMGPTSQPMGLLRVLEISSISFQSRLATRAWRLWWCVSYRRGFVWGKGERHTESTRRPSPAP